MTLFQDVLATAPLFSSFVEADLVALASAMRERKLQTGEVLFRQGQHGDAMVLVVQGGLSILGEEGDGKSVELAQIGIGDIVGEMSALDPAPRSATVKATSEAVVWVLNRTMLEALMGNAPSVYASLLKGIGRAVTGRLDRTNKRIRTEAFGHIDVFEGPANSPEESSGQLIQRVMDPSELKALKGFTTEEHAQLLTSAPLIGFQSGQALCSEGKPGHTCFIIGGGEVEILRHSGTQEHRLAVLGPGAVVGQLALLHDSPRSATVRAKGNMWAVAIGRGAFGRLLSTHNALGIKLHEQVVVAGIRQLRLASRMLTELRMAQDEMDALLEPPAASPKQDEPRDVEERREHAPRSSTTPEPRRARPPQPTATERARRARSAWQAVDGGTTHTRAPRRGRKKAPTKEMALYVTAALSEWGLSLSDLDDIQVSVPEGQITAAELKARRR